VDSDEILQNGVESGDWV